MTADPALVAGRGGGLQLLFKLGIPIALAVLAQMVIMAVNDLDLSMGAFVSFVACVTATCLVEVPLIGGLILLGAIGVSALFGAAMFMFLVVWVLNTYGFGAGFRLISTGLIIITVILLASHRSSTR